jgi:hypothetical protein
LKETGRLLFAFGWGALATVAGSLLAFKLLPLRVLGADGWKVAAALTARHIGGSVNYVAVRGRCGSMQYGCGWQCSALPLSVPFRRYQTTFCPAPIHHSLAAGV